MSDQQEQAPPKLPAIQSGNAVKAIVPNDFESAFRIANAVFKSGMAPKGINSAEQAMVTILHGLEVGMSPMMALQSIATINGRPTLYGDGALGLVQSSGLMEWIKESYEGVENTDTFKAVCEVKRKGDKEIKRGEFSIAQAKKAQLFGKPGPWQQYLKRMLQMRARGFALRDGFSDALRGLHIAEEVQDIPTVKDAAPRDAEPPPPPPGVVILGPTESAAEPPAPPSAPVSDIVTPPEPAKPIEGEILPNPEVMLKWIDDRLAKITDPFELPQIWEEECMPRLSGAFPPDIEEANAIFDRHEKRLDP